MIKEFHEKLINQEITSEKLTEDYFDKIEQKDGEIQAYLSLNKEFALDKARSVDKKIKKGEEIDLLAGIPCAIKDNICVDGLRVTAGSKILENYVSPYDATVIKKLKEQRAVFLGKTNLDEFAMGSSTENSAYQFTRNPYDPKRVPGGSSGGSAVATIKTISLPHTKYALACYYIIMPAEVSANLARYDGIRYARIKSANVDHGNIKLKELYLKQRGLGFGSEAKRRIILGTFVLSSGYYDAYYKKAQQVRALVRKDFEDAFQRVDVIFAPVTPHTAFKI